MSSSCSGPDGVVVTGGRPDGAPGAGTPVGGDVGVDDHHTDAAGGGEAAHGDAGSAGRGAVVPREGDPPPGGGEAVHGEGAAGRDGAAGGGLVAACETAATHEEGVGG